MAKQIEFERIQRTGCGANRHVGDLQLTRRGFQVGVTEQDLNGTKIGSSFQQVRGKGVSQGMRMNRFGNTGCQGGVATSQVDCLRADSPGAVERGKQPVSGPLGSPIPAQQFQQFGGQQSLPVLAAFALAHPQHVAASIDVARLELGGFRDTESTAVQAPRGREAWQPPPVTLGLPPGSG